MDYTHADILAVAAPLGDGYWKQARVVLEKGDTAYAPGTTKKELAGEGFIHYWISPTGWLVNEMADGIYLQHKEG